MHFQAIVLLRPHAQFQRARARARGANCPRKSGLSQVAQLRLQQSSAEARADAAERIVSDAREQLGTAGRRLEAPPDTPTKTRPPPSAPQLGLGGCLGDAWLITGA